ncbi:MAG: helical backbone metal receptor [Mycobacteriales bacterium]
MSDTGPPVDDLGTPYGGGSPRRIVSLVPSLTESVARTAADRLAGATDYCSHPTELDLARIGGPKWPDLAAIRACGPDLVLANAEENRPQDIAALRAEGIPVWVTAPATVGEALESLARMLGACGLGDPGWLADARSAWRSVGSMPRRRALVPIWRRPWMVLGRDTFAGDVLRRLGVANVYASHAGRYPKVPLDDLLAARAALIVLPDEPYVFTAHNGPECFPGVDIALVSGRHLTWYGPSLVDAPRILAAQLAGARRLDTAGSAIRRR